MNAFPVFDTCPHCHCHGPGNLHRNGYYFRNGISEEVEVRIPICRLRCLNCGVTISILPDFLIPYFQHTIQTILERIHEFLVNKKRNGSRQLLRFHLHRFLKKLNWVYTFFVDLGKESERIKDPIQAAVRYISLIREVGESRFLRESWGHFSSYFLAN